MRYRVTCDGYELGVYDVPDWTDAAEICACEHGYANYMHALRGSKPGDPVRRWEFEEAEEA